MHKAVKFLINDILPLLILLAIYLVPILLLHSIFNFSGSTIIKSVERISLFDKESYLNFFQGIITIDAVFFGFYSAVLVFMLNRLVGAVRERVKDATKEIFAPMVELILEVCGASLIILIFMIPLMMLLFSLNSAFSGIGDYGVLYGMLYAPNNSTGQLTIVNNYQSIVSMSRGWFNGDISQAVTYAFFSAYLIFFYIFVYIYYAATKD